MLKLYKNKYLLDFSEDGHSYKVEGKKQPSVTGIIKILDKPGLPQWAANKTVEYIFDKSIPFPEYQDRKAWIVTTKDLAFAKRNYLNSRDDSAIIGKAVHSWIEGYIRRRLAGEMYTKRRYTESMAPSIEAFLKWEKQFKPEYIFSERVVYSPNGHYCGTSDCGAWLTIDGKQLYIVLDFKTGVPEKEYDTKLRKYTGRIRPYTTTYLQDALYDLAIEEEDRLRADGYGALHLPLNSPALFAFTKETTAFRELGKSIVQTYHLLNAANALNEWNL